MQTKIIVVTGGVLSGLGKGIATASLARLLKDSRKIVTVKCDGYLNVDPGTMNPIEHGEVFVLEDGGEVDMDFGHYERFLGITCKSEWNLTSGKIFSQVIAKERKGDYLGKTIQIFPHIVQEILDSWDRIIEKEKPDILTIEIGGPVGDVENSWFIEAARKLKKIKGGENVAYVHLTYVPFLANVGEQKTKPAQRDLELIRSKGILPDIVVCRSENELSPGIKEKIALFCDSQPENIISGCDVSTIYQIPLQFQKEGLLKILDSKLGIKTECNMQEWQKLVENIKNPKKQATISICGKYTKLKDSYASIIEALTHAGAHCESHVEIKWIETTDPDKVIDQLKNADGILVPGGFGERGAEGKIKAIQHARENNIPYLGICYGLQLAVVEFARNVCKLSANSTENEPKTQHPVIDYIPEQKSIVQKGGTMRLGAYKAELRDSKIRELYAAQNTTERHRHRYEVNPEYHGLLTKNGLCISGISPCGKLAEFIELPNHPYFVATQAHNELTSRLEKPNPLFLGFIQAALRKL